jgi:hypothetical protein
MISITTKAGLKAELLSGGDAWLQVFCDTLNETHFRGELPPISVCAVSRLEHPTAAPLHAIALKVEEVPEVPVLRSFGTPWVILIHRTYCELPFVVQLMLHEMTHVLLPDESPFHSKNFWATLKEKWKVDCDLVLGVGLNADETPSGLAKRLLEATSIHRSLRL